MNICPYLSFIVFVCFFPLLSSAGVLTVTSTANAGEGSLRQLISDAAVNDTILFDASVDTIKPLWEYWIAKDLVIRGNEELGIVIDGDIHVSPDRICHPKCPHSEP